MSALRLGRLPDGTRHVVDLGPAVGRRSVSRLGIRGGGPPVVPGWHVTGESQRDRDARQKREHVARKAAL